MTTIRFLHTADWQLGLRRHFLSEEALPRYRQARIDALRAMAELARTEGCAFALACGDLFESNQIDRATLDRALEALATFPCPVFLLPGNHDPLDAGTIYRPHHFADHPRARILASSQPIEAAPGVELVAAPWHSKRPQRDLVAAAIEGLGPAPHLRILAAHGETGLAGEHDNPARIDLATLQAAMHDGRLHYAALGDRHSLTEVTPRIWYPGTPEPTAFRETDPGFALVVELDAESCRVARHRVGRWKFLERAWALDGVDPLAEWLESLPDKDRTVLKLDLAGTLGLQAKAALDILLARAAGLFAGLQPGDGLTVLPDELDLSTLGFSGFVRDAVDELAALAPSDRTACDALALLYRLATEGPAR